MYKRKPPLRLPADAGVTLLELMFASGVLALALSLLFGSLMSVSMIGGISESRTAATVEMASVLEEVRTLELEELMAYAPEILNKTGAEQAIALSFLDGDGNTVSLPLPEDVETPDNLPNPLTVRVQVVWSDNLGRAYSVEAVTLHGR